MVVASGPWPLMSTLPSMPRSSSALPASVPEFGVSSLSVYVPLSSEIVSIAVVLGSPGGHSPNPMPEALSVFADVTASLSEHWWSFASTTSVWMFGWMTAAPAGAARTRQAALSASGRRRREGIHRPNTDLCPRAIILADDSRENALRNGRQVRPHVRAHVHELPLLELELLELRARELRPDVAAGAGLEVHADLEAEVDDALDLHLLRALGRQDQDVEVVRSHVRLAQLRDGPDELHDELVRRRVVQLARGADLLDLALVHDHDLLGHLHGLLLVVRHEDGGHVHLVVQTPQPLAQLLADGGVECAERLVEEQHLRLHRQRARERHPLALATGELRRVALAVCLEMNELQQLVHALADALLRRLADRQREADVVAHRHVLERRVVLEHEADVALAGRLRCAVLARDQHPAAVRHVEPGDHPEQCRLTAAGRAEQGREGTGRDIERDVVDRDELAESPCHVLDGDAHATSPLRFIRFIDKRVIRASSASTTDAAYAPVRSKDWKRSSTWRVSDSVSPRMWPDTTLTAPNSPRARAVVSTTP